MIRAYHKNDLPKMISVWNEIVREGDTFPQEELLDTKSGAAFFAAQDFTEIYLDEQGNLCGLYILHPSNVGRCGHICSASFALSQDQNKTQISEALVKHCIMIARAMNYRILQFDAVAESNTNARTLYERLGFHPLGTIPNGFRMKDGRYENICPYYFSLV